MFVVVVNLFCGLCAVSHKFQSILAHFFPLTSCTFVRCRHYGLEDRSIDTNLRRFADNAFDAVPASVVRGGRVAVLDECVAVPIVRTFLSKACIQL